MRFRLRVLLVAAAALGVAPAAFPSGTGKPIRLVVGMAPGTVVDLTSRAVAAKLSQRLGQPVVVENKAGAGGSIAANFVARAEPDGHTLWYGTVANIHPIYLKNNSVILGKNLQPVSNVLSTPYVFYTSGRLPVRSMDDLVAYAKTKPANSLNFALQTATFDLLMHVLKAKTGLTYTTIPYTGGGPASIKALRAGEADFTIGGVPGYAPHLQAGALRALFITTPRRSSVLPNVPTAAEAGIEDFVAASTVGIMAPMTTPADVVERLNKNIVAVLSDPELVQQLRNLGSEPAPTTPQGQQRTYDSEMKVLTRAASEANYQPK